MSAGRGDEDDPTGIARAVVAGDPPAAVLRRLAWRDRELDLRRRANRARTGARTADSLAKFGGGSLLTATVALLIGGSTGWPVVVVVVSALLVFLIATIFIAVFELRAVAHEHAADRVAAALKEVSP